MNFFLNKLSIRKNSLGKITLILFSVLFFKNSISQNQTYSLIVVHYDPASKGDFKQLVFSYRFLNGHFQGREELLSFYGRVKEKDYIRTDIGHNTLYRNRYLITGIGNIIDLKEKKVLFDQKATLVRCSNDSAIYYTNDAFKGKYYSVYNFTTKQYSEVKALLFKAKAGVDIEFDKSSSPYKLNFYPTDKAKVMLMADAGYGQPISGESKKPDPPVFWIDNNSFVYCQFNQANTEISFVKMSIENKSSLLLGKAIVKPQTGDAYFVKINKWQAQFTFGDKKFLVDAEKSLVNEMLFTAPDNGFAAECKDNPYGHIVKLKEKEIGKYHFQLNTLKCDQDIAALVKELRVGAESYQQGLCVWNNSTNAWENVDAEEVVALIGWIK